MAAQPKPLIQQDPRPGTVAANAAPGRVIPNEPSSTVAGALANGKAQVAATQK